MNDGLHAGYSKVTCPDCRARLLECPMDATNTYLVVEVFDNVGHFGILRRVPETGHRCLHYGFHSGRPEVRLCMARRRPQSARPVALTG